MLKTRFFIIISFILVAGAVFAANDETFESDNEKDCLDLGDAYYVSMQYPKAVEAYQKAISLNPGALYAYKMAGDSCIALGDFDNAKKFYTALLDANEKAVLRYDPAKIEEIKAVLRALPETYKDIDDMLKKGMIDEAETVLKKRISMNSEDFIAMTALAGICQNRGERKIALKLLESATRIEPDYPIAHLYLGRLRYLMRQFEAAVPELNMFKEKIKKLPNMDEQTKNMYIGDLYYLSEVYFALERREDGRMQLEEILKLNPKEQAAYHDLGVYYYRYEHNRSKAYQNFKKAINIEPSTDIAKKCEYNIEFMRNNPDSRMAPDFSFIDR